MSHAMRKLVLKMSVSVDGFVGGPNGEIDWIFRTMDEEATAWTVGVVGQAGLHIMGSRTFHDMAAYWPSSTQPFAAPMNEIPKVFFSRSGSAKAGGATTTRALVDARAQAVAQPGAATPAIESWNAARVASGDLAEEIARLKQEPGKDIVAHGGAAFAQSLARLGLVDEYRLLVHPVALGRGLPLFSGLSAPVDLALVEVKPFRGGAVALSYRRR
jgi:dihydrofolate reductase